MRIVILLTFFIALGLIVPAKMPAAGAGRAGDSIPRPELGKLYEEADAVAFVKIVSGDTESYEDTIYKAAVIKGYKGTTAGETVFFGPYVSYEIGSEYLVFLKKSGKQLAAIAKKGSGPGRAFYGGTSEYSEAMYGGYSVLPVSYECGLGTGPSHENCDYAVNAATVILPKTLKPVREEEEEGSGAAFVRKNAFDAFLDNLKKK